MAEFGETYTYGRPCTGDELLPQLIPLPPKFALWDQAQSNSQLSKEPPRRAPPGCRTPHPAAARPGTPEPTNPPSAQVLCTTWPSHSHSPASRPRRRGPGSRFTSASLSVPARRAASRPPPHYRPQRAAPQVPSCTCTSRPSPAGLPAPRPPLHPAQAQDARRQRSFETLGRPAVAAGSEAAYTVAAAFGFPPKLHPLFLLSANALRIPSTSSTPCSPPA